MKLREIRIKNFRCLQDITIPIDDTTILVGANNSGKTALLDALKLALPRNVIGRTNPFEEYDYFMANEGDSPQTSEGIEIELWFREDQSDEWPVSLTQSLNEITQTTPDTDLDAIGLRLSSKFDQFSKEMLTKWEFLTVDGQALGGKGASSGNLARFLAYIRIFYLSALRDAEDEFSPRSSRSQFWRHILRDLKIPDEQRNSLGAELEKLNQELLKADPRLKQVSGVLDKVQQLFAMTDGQQTSIQALPLKPWELLSKSEVVMKNPGTEIDFPLSRYGQGMQSLAVLFLFQAYIEVLLKPSFQPETEAILALEEPEAHLHPQATRLLAANLSAIKSQKIISSHSPFFIQEIPLTQIRMFRREGNSSKVFYIPRAYPIKLSNEQKLAEFCKRNIKYRYNEINSILTINGRMEQNEFRELLTIYAQQREIHSAIKKVYEASQFFLSKDDLSDLETYAKRIRGEVLFARAWLLCEGQCEYLLIRYFAEVLQKPFDQAGVTIIDFQNNGSPGAFVALAKAFQIPWMMTCDADAAGKEFIEQVKKRGVKSEEINQLIHPLPEDGIDLELFLIKNGFLEEYLEIMAAKNVKLIHKPDDADFYEEFASILRKDKTGNILALIEKLKSKGNQASRVPDFFIKLIHDITSKAL